MKEKNMFEAWLRNVVAGTKSSALVYYNNQPKHQFENENEPIMNVIYMINWREATSYMLPEAYKDPLELGHYLIDRWARQAKKNNISRFNPGDFKEALYQIEKEPLLTEKSPDQFFAEIQAKIVENKERIHKQSLEVEARLKAKIENETYEKECARLIEEEEKAKKAAEALNSKSKKLGRPKYTWEQKLQILLSQATDEQLRIVLPTLQKERDKRANIAEKKRKAEADRKAKEEAKRAEIEARRKEQEQRELAKLNALKRELEKKTAEFKKKYNK